MLAVPLQALFGQLLIGLINGSFYALLSLGLAIIFGLLNVINFCHGALYMLGAFVAWGLLEKTGIGYWPALLIAPPRCRHFSAPHAPSASGRQGLQPSPSQGWPLTAQ